MIGDQRQLPPYQESRTREAVEAWRGALGRALEEREFRDAMAARFGLLFRSLEALARARGPLSETERGWLRPFEFLFDRLPTRHRLEEQFRMEAPLSRAVGSVFYGRPFSHRKQELVAAGHLVARPLGDALPAGLDVPMLWLDTPHMTEDPDATEDAAKRGVRDNQCELEVIVGYLRRLRPGRPIDLAILTPYNAQKRLLLADTRLRAACERLTDHPFEQVVRTTDEYQGREAELTVLSLVRNNSLGARAWGFMSEPERLNVMFSRARFRQVVVGCSAHIERHAEECPWLLRFWRAYQAEARDPGCARILAAREVSGG
ncbi:AAA domain-containing protein [Nannocystis pusilla]|uniref:AAA domain-containing protein n=1 Tax=Nannocystis pusilla TaxID=889268 RepID=UPI003DA234CC